MTNQFPRPVHNQLANVGRAADLLSEASFDCAKRLVNTGYVLARREELMDAVRHLIRITITNASQEQPLQPDQTQTPNNQGGDAQAAGPPVD